MVPCFLDSSPRHWQSSDSGRWGNRDLAPGMELKPAQPSCGQGEPRRVLRPVLSAQGRVCDTTRNSKNHVHWAAVGKSYKQVLVSDCIDTETLKSIVHSLKVIETHHFDLGGFSLSYENIPENCLSASFLKAMYRYRPKFVGNFVCNS